MENDPKNKPERQFDENFVTIKHFCPLDFEQHYIGRCPVVLTSNNKASKREMTLVQFQSQVPCFSFGIWGLHASCLTNKRGSTKNATK